MQLPVRYMGLDVAVGVVFKLGCRCWCCFQAKMLGVDAGFRL